MSAENRENNSSENLSKRNNNYSNNKKHENHNYRRHRSNHESGSGTGSEQELESLRIEYQNLFDRSRSSAWIRIRSQRPVSTSSPSATRSSSL